MQEKTPARDLKLNHQVQLHFRLNLRHFSLYCGYLKHCCIFFLLTYCIFVFNGFPNIIEKSPISFQRCCSVNAETIFKSKYPAIISKTSTLRREKYITVFLKIWIPRYCMVKYSEKSFFFIESTYRYEA